MDWLSDIRTWLSDNEAMLSAAVAIMVLVGAVVAGVRAVLSRRSEASTEPAKDEDPLLALPTGPVVAVLPFENLSEDPKPEYFSDGLTDDIITALSRFKDLFVIARNSTFRYKGQAVDVRQLSKELGARYVLEGSVQRSESRLRVTVQLLDAKDGTHLWADRYDRELSASDIFEVQDEITERVVGTIAGLLGVISRARFAESKHKPTESLDAYESVLQAVTYSRYNLPGEHAKVRDSLERAVKADPAYADAWAYLCFTYLEEYHLNYNPRPDSLDRALDAAQKAAAADPGSQRARSALAWAYFFRHELDAFFVEFDRAITLNPNDAGALGGFGSLLRWVGDERGIVLVRRAMKLDPFHPTWFYFPIADHYFQLGDYEAALANARKVETYHFWLPAFLAGIYAELGRQREAHSRVEELLRLYPAFTSKTLIEELRKYNRPDDVISRWVAALRKAGLPE